MALLDPIERQERGARKQASLLAQAEREPETLVQASWRDYIFAEIWTRPGLDLRSRYLIAMSSAANESDRDAALGYARGALSNQELTLPELREAALHVSVYSGWTYGALLDDAITQAAQALGLSSEAWPPIRENPWDPDQRHDEGGASFRYHMKFGSPPPRTAYFEGGILNFVFGEMWNRPGLDQRSRRWLTLVGVANSSAHTPIHSHIWSAIASGNATVDELYEFVLQYAVHAGWPRASFVQGVVMQQADRIAKGLSYTD
ncbi:carboxymuconolactone decarboxylase family protein [Sphingobium yanoikuyae]|uniref:carboxymuconolactone decarboxylase family protein n=1 Tax=Sphingobium yanoikuyae TaxID=13690 RepID=UPI002FDAF23D